MASTLPDPEGVVVVVAGEVPPMLSRSTRSASEPASSAAARAAPASARLSAPSARVAATWADWASSETSVVRAKSNDAVPATSSVQPSDTSNVAMMIGEFRPPRNRAESVE